MHRHNDLWARPSRAGLGTSSMTPSSPIDLPDPCYLQGIEDEINCVYTPPHQYNSAQRQRWTDGQVYSSFHNMSRTFNPRFIDQPTP